MTLDACPALAEPQYAAQRTKLQEMVANAVFI
jgi:hypothetical protein